MQYFITAAEHAELLTIAKVGDRDALDRLRDRTATLEHVDRIAGLIQRNAGTAESLRFRRGVLAEPLDGTGNPVAAGLVSAAMFERVATPPAAPRALLPLSGPALPMFRQMVTQLPAKSLAELLLQVSPEYVRDLLAAFAELQKE
jgi:hypothetical protein